MHIVKDWNSDATPIVVDAKRYVVLLQLLLSETKTTHVNNGYFCTLLVLDMLSMNMCGYLYVCCCICS